MAGPVDIFLSYAPEDDSLREELEQHLSGLQRAGIIRTWSAQRVMAGERTQEVVEAKLAGAKVVLLLVSASYLASDYLYEVEAMAALGRERAGKARVIPVLLHACHWEIAAFEGLSPLPANGKPVSSWSNRNEAWAEVVRGLRAAINEAAAPAVAPVPAYEPYESQHAPEPRGARPKARPNHRGFQMGLLHDPKKDLECRECQAVTPHTKLSFAEETENVFAHLGSVGTVFEVCMKFLDHKMFGLFSKQLDVMSKLDGDKWGYKCDVCGTVTQAV
jgi:TIR domain